jgi:hypothetical protein
MIIRIENVFPMVDAVFRTNTGGRQMKVRDCGNCGRNQFDNPDRCIKCVDNGMSDFIPANALIMKMLSDEERQNRELAEKMFGGT